jgi:hypothetical protein
MDYFFFTAIIRLCDAPSSASTGHFEGTADVALKLAVSNGFSGGLWIFPVMVALGVIIQFFETFAEWKKLVICTGRTNFPDNPTQHVSLTKYAGPESPAVGFEDGADLLNDVAQFSVASMIKIGQNFSIRFVTVLSSSLNIPLDNGRVGLTDADHFEAFAFRCLRVRRSRFQ